MLKEKILNAYKKHNIKLVEAKPIDENSLPGSSSKFLNWLKTLDKNEPVTIYGDYDADGILATAMLTLYLRECGYKVEPNLPSRYAEGYGVNEKSLEKIKDATQVAILDCGTLQSQQTKNMWGNKVITIDHHEPQETPADPQLINPHLDLNPEKARGLSTGGILTVIFSNLAQAGDPIAKKLLPNLTTMGTTTLISDVCEITPTSKEILEKGIQLLQEYNTSPITELTNKIQKPNPTIKDLAWYLVPVLNAAGRLEHPEIALNAILDTSNNENRWDEVIELNNQRKTQTQTWLAKALPQVQLKNHPLALFWDKNLPAGLAGIVAGQLAQTTNKPAIALFYNKEENQWEGSGRSPSGINFFESLQPIKKIFTKFGGHNAAFGVAVKNPEVFEKITKNLNLKKEASTEITIPITFEDITKENYEFIQKLGPFGRNLPEPKFEIKAKLYDPKPVKKGYIGKLIENGKSQKAYVTESSNLKAVKWLIELTYDEKWGIGVIATSQDIKRVELKEKTRELEHEVKTGIKHKTEKNNVKKEPTQEIYEVPNLPQKNYKKKPLEIEM